MDDDNNQPECYFARAGQAPNFAVTVLSTPEEQVACHGLSEALIAADPLGVCD